MIRFREQRQLSQPGKQAWTYGSSSLTGEVGTKKQLVQGWMTHDPITVTRSTTLPEARRMMEENGIRHLPVVDGSKLVGIVTWGDIREASPSDADPLSIFEQKYLLHKWPVGKIMTRDPITVTPTTAVTCAAQIMLEHKIGGLPVVEGGGLVGVITESDIFRMLVMGKAA